MEVHINDQKLSAPEKSTLYDALQLVKLRQSQGIAIAVNDQVVNRSAWNTYQLKDQDKILIIKATQGG